MYLFMFVVFFEIILINKRNLVALKNWLKEFLVKSLFFNAFDTSLV